MLKSIDPLLNADVLYALRSMGHGDDLVICDTNFPADSVALVHGGVDVRRTMPGSRLSASLIWRAFAAALLRWPDVDP